MTLLTRREFLKVLGAGSLIAAVPGSIILSSAEGNASSIFSTDLTELALNTVRKLGAEYADIRVCDYAWQWIHLSDRQIQELEDNRDSGFGIRVLVNGSWGFAASYRYSEDSVINMAKRAVALAKQAARIQEKPVRLAPVDVYNDKYQSTYNEDPVDVPFSQKMELLYTINDRLLSKTDIVKADSFLFLAREDKLFCSTIGSRIQQRIVRTYGEYSATAQAKGDFQSRKFIIPPRTYGYEHVKQMKPLEHIDRIASEAVEKVNAEPCPKQVKRDLVIMPSNLWLTIHESVGHPTELDRVLGWEANYAGTSFATTDKLGKLRYAADKVNFKADRTIPGGMATCGYDDEGVKTSDWYIVRNGLLINYQTSRETAAILGQKKSNGCTQADSWSHIPIIRIPNLSLEADQSGPTLEELIADTKEGILIDGDGSYSIDQQRRNFQFGGDAFWEIKNGKKTRMLKKVIYQSYTTDFWNSVDAICGPKYFELYGTPNCGKGQPGQQGQMGHGAAPVRVKSVLVGVA